MKIHADKVEAAPGHALTIRDVKFILRAVPPAWVQELTVTRLSNSLDHYRSYAFFSKYDGGLTIYSRRGTKKQAVIAVLSALAAASLGIRLGFGRNTSEAHKRRINRVIQPLVDEIMEEVMPPTKRGWWGHPIPSSHETA